MPRPLKIVHVVHSFGVGGLENGVVNLINYLDSKNFHHVVCCLTAGGKSVERIQNKNVEVIEFGLRRTKYRFPVRSLSRLFRGLNADVVHTRGWGTIDAIVAARVARVPWVVHGEHGREASDPEGRNRKRNLVRKALSPIVDRFVTVSDDLHLWLARTIGISEKKVVTIHNGVDTEKFCPLLFDVRTEFREDGRSPWSVVRGPSSIVSRPWSVVSSQASTASSPWSVVGSPSSALSALRRSLGLPVEAILVGTVGRLDPVKDHKNLLNAFARIARTEPPVFLVVVGDGPMRAEIESHASNLGISARVKFLGERDNIPELLRAFDVFALNSIAEGISNTILEAMASGLPIVATRVGGNPELVEDDVSGQLIPPRNPDALTAALERYLREPETCRRHGIAARERAEKYFSLNRMASRYEKLYRSLAGA
jgi:glycosyltransferase involved in cell wall biosynthesis